MDVLEKSWESLDMFELTFDVIRAIYEENLSFDGIKHGDQWESDQKFWLVKWGDIIYNERKEKMGLDAIDIFQVGRTHWICQLVGYRNWEKKDGR